MAYNRRYNNGTADPITDAQRNLIEKLVEERDVPFDVFREMTRQLQAVNTKKNASAWITILLETAKAKKPVTADTAAAELRNVLDAQADWDRRRNLPEDEPGAVHEDYRHFATEEQANAATTDDLLAHFGLNR